MADIKTYTDQIKNAVYGEDVRNSIINALNKVNDDNEALKTIRHDVVTAKDAVEEEMLNFSSKKEAAEAACKSLVEATNAANSAKSELETATTAAENAKNGLDGLADAANNAKSGLETALGNAGTVKTELETAIRNAETIKNGLDASTEAADTAKASLETAIENAGTVKTELEALIADAGDTMSGLSGTVTEANAIKESLDASVEAANTAKTAAEKAKSDLDASVSSAEGAKTDLETVVGDAKTAKSGLDESVEAAGATKTELDKSVESAGTAKTELTDAAADAETKKTELDASISEAGTAKSDLDASTETANKASSALSAENETAQQNLADLQSENFDSQKILEGVANLEAYLGLTDDVLGLEVGYENKSFKRLAGAANKNQGTDFDTWNMYGGRKKCNVGDDGTINAWYGDKENYKEDGTNGQVMVYQPKFYYRVSPVKCEAQKGGLGYHLRKANYYISDTPRTGFKLHPAFYDANGNEVDYVLIGAYEACVYNSSTSEYVEDGSQTTVDDSLSLSSVADKKPAGNFIRTDMEKLAKNRGENWHSLNVKIASMEQLLMIIELGAMDFQKAIGQGVTNSSNTEALATGSTASLGNGTGEAQTEGAESGKKSICYRGVENDWGNVWKFVDGVNIWGNSKMAGGQPYVCKNFGYAESKNNDNYEGAGFTVANSSGYINAMGYSQKCDWLFMGSDTNGGNSLLPVGDYQYVSANLNGYRIARLGGGWNYGSSAGGFYWYLNNHVGYRARGIGGRLVYVPAGNT